MVIRPYSQWAHRPVNMDDYDKFVTKWLDPFTKDTLAQPAMSITNGWMAEYHENQWYTDELEITVFGYDNRGQGKSIKQGELDAVQGAIDANYLISRAFDDFDTAAREMGIETSNKLMQGNCMGTMALAALFAGRMPLADRIDATILISPVSTFSLPGLLKMTYFLPEWFANFAIKYIAEPVAKITVPGEDSEFSREKALNRLRDINVAAASKQAKQMFWKENVEKYWKYMDVPALILTGRNDPMVTIEQSAEVFELLKYPIWFELQAPDHLLLEGNIEYVSQIIPEFARNPWAFYEKYKHVEPEI